MNLGAKSAAQKSIEDACAFTHNPDGTPFEMRICETVNHIGMEVRSLNPHKGALDLFEAILWCDIYEYA